MAPYMAVARSTFCYHYMPALVYGELIVARSLDLLAGPRYNGLVTKLFLAVIGLVWFHYTPWIYGFPLTNDGHQRRRWIERACPLPLCFLFLVSARVPLIARGAYFNKYSHPFRSHFLPHTHSFPFYLLHAGWN